MAVILLREGIERQIEVVKLIGSVKGSVKGDLERVMKLARQFGKEIRSFMHLSSKEENEVFSDTFLYAAKIVQKIGRLYTEDNFESE